jgi:hypothetical protein
MQGIVSPVFGVPSSAALWHVESQVAATGLSRPGKDISMVSTRVTKVVRITG